MTADEPHATFDATAFLAWIDRDELPRTPEYPCPYLPGRLARQRALFTERLPAELYHELMDRGFRRNGRIFYAMDCRNCRLCVPLRLDVSAFEPSRSQRRVRRRNQDVVVHARMPEYSPETFAMYRRYLAAQHANDQPPETPEQFRESLYARVVDTVEMTYSLDGRIVAISLLDVSKRSVSAVYHFYEPEHACRSLGVFSVLAEIEWTRRLGVKHYYLGYWVEGAKTMQYKADYRPHECWRDGRWLAAGD